MAIKFNASSERRTRPELTAGNVAELEVYPGGIHAFNALPSPLAAAANKRIFAFLKKRLAE